MDKKSEHPDESILSALQGVKKRAANILDLVEETIRGVPIPETVTVSMTKSIADPIMWIDAERVRKALADLMINAVEAMPEGGELAIGIEGDRIQVIITVSDTGRGISKENMDNILIPFFTTKPPGEGTGLGLATAYATVKMHSGKLEIESNADPDAGPTGTSVKIALPRGRQIYLDSARLIIHDDE
ncbi:MAG TPA: ATP-binding protein [Deltaproteobacteria bacterium]|jgi:signal transduction histidine kinase|nr:ATP-binding protein [Deltaproteobacteria bacterium]HOI06584.1 ATP-binding protein [Deltaproteobacteria bacterium]